MISIRNFKKSDFEVISSWWDKVGGHGPELAQMPEESSFIMTIDDNPVLFLSVYLTNTDIAYFENLISNPDFTNRKKEIDILINYAWNFVKEKGYNWAVGFTTVQKLADRYIQMGWDKQINNTIILGKKL